MTNYLYLECLSHDPIIQGVGEVGAYLEPDLDNLRSWIVQRDKLVEKYRDDDSLQNRQSHYWTAVKFFVAHPHCDLGIIDEYGTSHSIMEVTGGEELGLNDVIGQVLKVETDKSGFSVTFSLTPEAERVLRRSGWIRD